MTRDGLSIGTQGCVTCGSPLTWNDNHASCPCGCGEVLVKLTPEQRKMVKELRSELGSFPRLSSYRRMKQRAEIAEAELADMTERFEYVKAARDAWIEIAERAESWTKDFWTVVGGVLLASALIAAIVWGVWG